jgi:TolA-binding protein
MKKSLILFPTALLAIFVIFSVIDRSDYVVEKRIWKIQQQFAVKSKYGILSKEDSENLAAMYQGLIRQYPKSALLPQIYLHIGQIYVVDKDFEKARTNYAEVLRQIPQQKDLCSIALLRIGLTYEQEKKDVLALKTYQRIINNYSLTEIGLNMPLYMAGYYHRLNNDAETKNAFRQAERFYRKAVQENTGSSKGFNALRFLAVTYLVQKKWEDALKTFEKTLWDYSLSPYLDWKTAGSIVYSINAVSFFELKTPNQPIAFYQMFIEKRPGYPLNNFLKQVIVSLQDLKNGKKSPLIREIGEQGPIIPRYN